MTNKTTFRFTLLFIILTFLFSFVAEAWDGDQLDNDEKVVFFPSYGYFKSSQNKWVIIIQGHIFESSTSSVKRSTAISGFETYTGSTVQDEDELITCYPNRQFILIGDSGERDPEISWAFLSQLTKRHTN